jgi:hypothetical protein
MWLRSWSQRVVSEAHQEKETEQAEPGEDGRHQRTPPCQITPLVRGILFPWLGLSKRCTSDAFYGLSSIGSGSVSRAIPGAGQTRPLASTHSHL